MSNSYNCPAMLLAIVLLWAGGIGEAQAQFTHTWLDVGSYHMRYTESGAAHEGAVANDGMAWPAILRNSDHVRSKAFWVGVKDWTGPEGRDYPYFVARIGPRGPGSGVTFPVKNELISQFPDPVVEVDGLPSFDKVAVVDAVTDTIGADRVLHNIHNMLVGVTVDRKVYAFSNQYHDNYHIIEYTYTNSGNNDADEEIEFPDQTLHEAMFFRIHRYSSGTQQEGQVTGGGGTWGKYNMVDVVGDGHQDYEVDFTAMYTWHGYRPEFTRYNNLGASIWNDGPSYIAEGDSVGRLAGGSFAGRAIIHADNAADDETYDPLKQPWTLGFMDQDEPLTSAGNSHQEYYEQGIMTRERQSHTPGLPAGRMWPHYADRAVPSGNFWSSTNDAATGKQGGHASTTAYGPYELEPGESVRVVIVEAAAGLSHKARMQVGIPYKRSGGNDDLVISYDANGDGTINDIPGFNYTYDPGSPPDETMTKNQWVMTARDSLFQTFERAIANYESGFDIPKPPLPPARFAVDGRPDRVELRWETIANPPPGYPEPVAWEIYRTNGYEDNLPYEQIARLNPSERSYDDTDLVRGTDYYYYIQAVGPDNPVDPDAIQGTPDGRPLRSGRYYTQTYTPATLKRSPGETLEAARVVPNPVNLGAEQGIRFAQEDRVAFFNIPGECTIKIYTEVGELVEIIEHTDGSGDETWNLTTSSRQLLVSGNYIAVIETPDGRRVFRKFVVIR